MTEHRWVLVLLSVLVALSSANADEAAPEAGLLRTRGSGSENDVIAPQEHRQLMGWWFSLLFQQVCLPGKLGDKCRAQNDWDLCQEKLQEGDENYEFCSEYSSESSYITDYSDGDGDGDGDGEAAVYSANSDSASDGSASDSSGGGGASKAFLWMLIVAAVATMFAIGAIIMGQRKKPNTHPLHGSVARRMTLFSEFADAALCSSAERPARVVEMTNSKDDYAMA